MEITMIITLILAAVAAFFVWKAWDGNTRTFNWSHGSAAVVAAAAAVWNYVSDFAGHLLGQ
jgi:hypothetical protein